MYKAHSMYKAHRIIIFLAVCLCVALAPILANMGRVSARPSSALDTPEIHNLKVRQCIEPTDFMRVNHMLLLKEWRNEFVRSGKTEYTNSGGQVYEMSLENGCFSCHSNRSAFCDSCHIYVAVDLNCWDCHNGEPKVQGGVAGK